MDSKERYNQTLFLETIKTGRTPKRSGLGSRLMLLAGITRPVMCTLLRNVKLYNTDDLFEFFGKDAKLNRLEYYKNTFTYCNNKRIVNDIYNDSVTQVFQKYLGKFYRKCSGGYVYVYFYNGVEINWGELDEALKLKYPNSHKVDKRGFVYFNYKKE